jgi:hypothetical protein
MIYFVACPEANAVKIGVSAYNPETAYARMSRLQSGCPLQLELLAVAPGYRDEEAGLHRRFAGNRIRGEWFSLTPELSEYISQFPKPPRPLPIDGRKIRRDHAHLHATDFPAKPERQAA